MEILYTCPYWGQESSKASLFLANVLGQGYDGVEINIPGSKDFIQDFQKSLSCIRTKRERFVFIAQQVLAPANESVTDYLKRLRKRMDELVELNPDFINSHTGKDYFSFDDNCRIIEVIENIAQRSGIPVLHETHRGRFSFHLAALLPYLEKFPQLKLTGDFSHWCMVSESMLQDQQAGIEKVIPHVQHIHARIGYEHGPQVNDPFAPEWEDRMDIFIGWWERIIKSNAANNKYTLTITPEFGPVPYMPTLPFSQKPTADQWKVNSLMKEMLSNIFTSKPVDA